MAIINNGKTVVQGIVSELLSSQDLIVSFEIDDVTKAKAWINNSTWEPKLKSSEHHALDFSISKNEIPLLTKSLENAG
jgi:hypothetical protein